MKRQLISALLGASALIAAAPAVAEIDASKLHGLEARAIGPATTSGRIAAIDAVISNPNTIVAGTATGGVWKSTNGGLNWTPLFDKEDVASIGAVAINQAHPDVIWVGTGEGNVRNSTSIGGGIYKSTDGGTTWNNMGLKTTERINRLALDPTNPDVLYVAAMGT
ncbi:MAG: sialidase, partial [Sphingomonadales bacterium]|nr:sialidase [Sphingomonadales bacterium]